MMCKDIFSSNSSTDFFCTTAPNVISFHSAVSLMWWTAIVHCLVFTNLEGKSSWTLSCCSLMMSMFFLFACLFALFFNNVSVVWPHMFLVLQGEASLIISSFLPMTINLCLINLVNLVWERIPCPYASGGNLIMSLYRISVDSEFSCVFLQW